MSAPFEMLSRAFIRNWLEKLIQRHGSHRRREGCTIDSLANYLEIPSRSLVALARRDTATIGKDRQRLLSKVIAMVENGQLEFERQGRKKVGVIRDHPKPICRYRVEFGSGRPILKMVGRPASFQAPPTFKSLSLKT